jgi:hypothetical protein
MSKKSRIGTEQLALLEKEFRSLLVACLRECAGGRWGLFGQNDHLDPDHRYLNWPEAARLTRLAHDILSLHSESGASNSLCERFLHYRSLRGSNVPGEPKLAQQLLHEISVSPLI